MHRVLAYALGHEIPKQPDSEEILQHFDSLGLAGCSSGEDVCAKLRKLMFDEWMTHPDLYQHFLTGEQSFVSEAKLFLNNGQCHALGHGQCIKTPYHYFHRHGKYASFAHHTKGYQYFLHLINLAQAIMMLLKCL